MSGASEPTSDRTVSFLQMLKQGFHNWMPFLTSISIRQAHEDDLFTLDKSDWLPPKVEPGALHLKGERNHTALKNMKCAGQYGSGNN